MCRKSESDGYSNQWRNGRNEIPPSWNADANSIQPNLTLDRNTPNPEPEEKEAAKNHNAASKGRS